jgi:hypothetical protein
MGKGEVRNAKEPASSSRVEKRKKKKKGYMSRKKAGP